MGARGDAWREGGGNFGRRYHLFGGRLAVHSALDLGIDFLDAVGKVSLRHLGARKSPAKARRSTSGIEGNQNSNGQTVRGSEEQGGAQTARTRRASG
jgi:hypothetical protein